ncbi:DUF397 domain-containing protein [Streptomyces sp. NPDC001668]|uniref:DUF397 domain-containing protein n=1 Tax=unclassified Streptomyces TaxID=2593676 RepID=UPI0036BDB9A7
MWRKSSLSAQGNCVEIAFIETVLVRDSKKPDGPSLTFSRAGWSNFLGSCLVR